MTKKIKSCQLMGKNIPKELIDEGLIWVRKNKGTKLTKGGYGSPRISSEFPDCSMPLTFDHYNFCSLGCMYCFAYVFKVNNPAITNLSLRAVNIENMIKNMKGEVKGEKGKVLYEQFYKKKFLLHWGGLADPFCNFEKTNMVGYPLIQELGAMNYPTLFSFKGDAILKKEYRDLFEKYKNQKNFAFQVSIITRDDDLAKYVEVGVQSPTKRLNILKMLSDLGYWTILRLRPFIIGITDLSLDKLLDDALAAGVRAISTEFFAMDARCNTSMTKRYEWLASMIGVSDLKKYFSILSPRERGGYRRLNRLVKERYIKKMYKFCLKNNLVFSCSDPDFKELNMSGSCCGMPDNFPDNKLLENWSKAQLTYAIKEARRIYHTTGIKTEFTIDDIYPKEKTKFLDSKTLTNDHVGVIGLNSSDRNNMTHRTFLEKHWNNLRSFSNPRNYLHNKLIPIGIDENKNLVYRYNPHDYEKEWAEEGIDLTR